ncbi:MAG: hypothetical protein ACP5PN_11460 [Steroidobacteraceae bacterium]
MPWREVGLEGLNEESGAHEGVSLGVSEQAQDLLDTRACATTLLRIDRQGLQALTLHRAAQLPLDQRLREEREALHDEERLDATWVLQDHRRDLVDGPRRFESLLEGGMPLVRPQDLLCGQVAIIPPAPSSAQGGGWERVFGALV